MFEMAACTQTVSLFRALVFGADGACVSLGLGSIVPLLAIFVLAVVVLQWVARRAVARLFRPAVPAPAAPEDNGYVSPIRSMRRR